MRGALRSGGGSLPLPRGRRQWLGAAGTRHRVPSLLASACLPAAKAPGGSSPWVLPNASGSRRAADSWPSEGLAGSLDEIRGDGRRCANRAQCPPSAGPGKWGEHRGPVPGCRASLSENGPRWGWGVAWQWSSWAPGNWRKLVLRCGVEAPQAGVGSSRGTDRSERRTENCQPPPARGELRFSGDREAQSLTFRGRVSPLTSRQECRLPETWRPSPLSQWSLTALEFPR